MSSQEMKDVVASGMSLEITERIHKALFLELVKSAGKSGASITVSASIVPPAWLEEAALIAPKQITVKQ